MLTADLVNARRRSGELRLVGLDDGARARAVAIAESLVTTATDHVGRSREELDAALAAIDVGAREVRLRDGLAKLALDRCDFAANEGLDPETIRSDVFTRASLARRELEPGARFDRQAVLEAIALARETSASAIEAALFSDLRGAHVLLAFDAPSAEGLVAAYAEGQAQAVLLRAVKVTIDIRVASPLALRALFRKLKFLRVLHTVTKTDEGQQIVIDGPVSMFESVTKYGLQLAMVLPALSLCESWKLVADVRWGKTREPLVFRLEGGARASLPSAEVPMPAEVEALVRSFDALETGWRVAPNAEILDLPGVGLTVPDLVFERTRARKKERVYLEVMGYWSRAAVWQRVELIQAGLAERILFAVSSRLRVSEQVLDDELPGALYVYKGTMSAKQVAERIEGLAARPKKR